MVAEVSGSQVTLQRAGEPSASFEWRIAADL